MHSDPCAPVVVLIRITEEWLGYGHATRDEIKGARVLQEEQVT